MTKSKYKLLIGDLPEYTYERCVQSYQSIQYKY